MPYPNTQQGVSQQLNQNNFNLTPQQYTALINLLAQQPQASPTSSQFDPNYFSKLLGLQNQQTSIDPAHASNQSFQPRPSLPNYQVVRIVDDPSTIGPQEVSMGMRNLFPSSDRQRLYMKTWNNDGLIDTDVYILQNEEKDSQPGSSEDIYAVLSKRVDELESALKKLQKQKTPSKSRSSKPKVSGSKDIMPKNEVAEQEDIDNG